MKCPLCKGTGELTDATHLHRKCGFCEGTGEMMSDSSCLGYPNSVDLPCESCPDVYKCQEKFEEKLRV